MPYIYKITNLLNNKIYVGATTRYPTERFKEHCRDASRFPDRPLYTAINKYGKENFVVDILEKCEETELEVKETYWIEELRSFKYGYNATTGGSGKPYADYDLIVALWNEGKSNKEIQELTSYDCFTIRKALMSNNISSEERKMRGDFVKQKVIAKLDINTRQILQVYPSIESAYQSLGKQSSGHIASVCNGKRKTAYGYGWKYLN